MRIIVKPQSELWDDGVRAASILAAVPLLASSGEDVPDEGDGIVDEDSEVVTPESFPMTGGTYAAGKWGRYVRAPDFYFDLMREFRPSFRLWANWSPSALALSRDATLSSCPTT